MSDVREHPSQPVCAELTLPHSTLKPSCAPDASPEDGTVAWFKQVVSLYHTLPTYEWLEKHGIVPDEERHYDLTSLKNALYEGFGAAPQIVCGENSDEIAEMWYYFNIRGSIRDGTAEFFEIGTFTMVSCSPEPSSC